MSTSSQASTLSIAGTKAKAGWSAWSDASLAGVLILGAALPYANALVNDFILTYDDGTQILKNPYVHSFRYLRQIFATNVWSYLGQGTVTNYYRPVMMLGYLICYKIFGPLAYGFHLASVVLHSAVVAVLFFVTRRMTSDRGVAFSAAALFALHPVHTEAVDWAAAVTDIEVALFSLGTFWFFLQLARPGAPDSEPARMGMTACYALALLSKEQALTLPLLVTWYEHLCRDDRGKVTWSRKVSRYRVLWLLAAGYVLLRIHFLGGFAPLLQRPRLGWPGAFVAAAGLFAQYLAKLVWPLHLCSYYVFSEDIASLLPWVLTGFGAFIILAWISVYLSRRDRFALFALLWLVVTLAPVLNARWMASNVFSERYLYLPSVGFCWLAARGASRCWLAAAGKRAWREIFLGTVVVLAALCFARIIIRNRDWRDDVTLYTRTLARFPDADPVISALGLAYWQRGDLDEAAREWRRALELRPQDASTWNYLGALLAQKKQYAAAVRYFEKSIQLDPNRPDSHLNLGAAYGEQGRVDLAETQFRAAIALSPLNVQTHNVLGKLYLDAGRLYEAEDQFRQSIDIERNLAAYVHLGYVYAARGEPSRAERAFRAALGLNPSESRAHFNLGALYAARGQHEQAIREYLAGLESDPHNAAARESLAKLKNRAADSGPTERPNP